MNKRLLSLLWVVLLCVSAPAIAAIPATVNYQGYITDSGGSPVNGLTNITFSAYNTEIGGAPLWTDTQSVSITQGLFSVELGSTPNPLPAGLFDTPIWIGVAVDTDGEMTPRRALTSAAFAFESDNALNLQGQAASVFDQSAHVIDTSNPHGVSAAQTNAASASEIVALQGQINTLLAAITSLQAGQMATDIALTDTTSLVSTLQTDVTINSAAVMTNTVAISTETASRVASDATQDMTIGTIQNNSVLGLDNILSLSGSNAVFTGVNLQVINGLGFNDAVNGTGNLLVGYDDIRVAGGPSCSLGEFTDQATCESNLGNWALSHKNGSHNIVVGTENNYSRSGGLVAGFRNTISGRKATVSGGTLNIAQGEGASVSGGFGNIASGIASSVSGGSDNAAQGVRSSISGGFINTAGGDFSSVSGGRDNIAQGIISSVSGGRNNTAQGETSSISGGQFTTATELYGSDATNVLAALVIETDARVAADTIQDSALSSVQANSVLALDGVLTLNGTEAQFTGVNVQIVNGQGVTQSTNSLGNLIVGYNEQSAEVRDGSHNIIVGRFNEYTSFAGLAVGYQASILAPYASVTGGFRNTAGAIYSSVSGGYSNTASGGYSSILGGESNTASGTAATVGGGRSNLSTGTSASVSGGFANRASADMASISGGQYNEASGLTASVSGGQYNQAVGISSSVTGGGGPAAADGNLALGDLTTILGGVNNLTGLGSCDETGCTDSAVGADQTIMAGATVSGGVNNRAEGVGASVSGGFFNRARKLHSSVSGGALNNAVAEASSISGGYDNAVFPGGNYASVSGGSYNKAIGSASSVSGGNDNRANGIDSSVNGGRFNIASGNFSSVSGGEENTASGHLSSVTGGKDNNAMGDRSTVVGGGGGEVHIEALFADDPSYDGFNNTIGNQAIGENSVVVGGISNVAHGIGTVIAGGWFNQVSGRYDVIAGGLFNELDMGTSVLVGGKQNISSEQFFKQSTLPYSGLYHPFQGADTSSVITGSEGTFGNVYIGRKLANAGGSVNNYFFAAPACPSGFECTVNTSSSQELGVPQELQDVALCTVAGVASGGAAGAACVVGLGIGYFFDLL